RSRVRRGRRTARPVGGGGDRGAFGLTPAVERAAPVRVRERGQVAGAVHEGDVRERLGEVSQLSLGRRVVLLGQEPDVVGEAGQLPQQGTPPPAPAPERGGFPPPEPAPPEHTPPPPAPPHPPP